MRFINIGLATVSLLSLLCTPIFAQKASVPPAVAAFCKRHAKAKTISFTLQTFYKLPPPLGTVSADLRPVQTFEVKATRPNLLSIVGTPDYEVRMPSKNGQLSFMFFGASDNIFRGNDQGCIHINTSKHFYTTGPAMKSLDRIPGGDHIRAYWVLYKNMIDGLKMIPSETLHGKTMVVFISADAHPENPDTKLYFEKDSGELRQISMISVGKDGKPQEWERFVYSHWQFDIPIPASTYDITPPPDTKPLPHYITPKKP